jgi:Helix-turn-helix domain
MAADQKELRGSLVKCPRCGTDFEAICLYRVEQVASLLGVAVGTVHGWMSKGLLPFRLWARNSRSIIRVIDSRDLLQFIDRRFPYPYRDPDHLTSRLWGWVQKQGSKGGKKSAALRKQASILKETGGNDRTEG